jgi:hypothetical protein
VNERLEQLISRLTAQIRGIPPAPTPPVQLDPDQFLELTVPALDVNLLGLLLETTPITVNATAEDGNGLLLGNILTTVLNTVDATPENLTGLNENLNALLAKVVGVLNVVELVLPTDILSLLPSVLQTLASPILVTPTPGATAEILDLVISSDTAGPPVDVDLLGLHISTSNIDASLLAQTGDGQILGNLLYNAANLLNPGGSTTLLSLLAQLGNLSPVNVGATPSAAPPPVSYQPTPPVPTSPTQPSGERTAVPRRNAFEVTPQAAGASAAQSSNGGTGTARRGAPDSTPAAASLASDSRSQARRAVNQSSDRLESVNTARDKALLDWLTYRTTLASADEGMLFDAPDINLQSSELTSNDHAFDQLLNDTYSFGNVAVGASAAT